MTDLHSLADELISDLRSGEQGASLDAVGTFAAWEANLTVNDYQALAILLAGRVVDAEA